MGKEFASHHSVDHSRKEYAYQIKDWITHVLNVSENYFKSLKRGLIGVYHSVSETHLRHYLKEFDFRYNNRSKLGIEDEERAAKTLKGIEGKRLTYYTSTNTPPAKPKSKPPENTLTDLTIDGGAVSRQTVTALKCCRTIHNRCARPSPQACPRIQAR